MLFYLDKAKPTSLSPLRGTTLQKLGWKEKDLETLVVQHIDRVVQESQLFVVHRERSYQEEPDIMALDRDGRLHIFELKRWGADQENLLQVLRYGQRFGQHDYAQLDYLFKRYAARVGAAGTPPDMADAHAKWFDLESSLPRERFNREQAFVVMTNGLDRATRDAIAYWNGKGLPVRPLVYRVYETRGKDIVFEVEPYGTSPDTVEADDLAKGLVVVNTNVTYMAGAWREMIDEGKAAAYYDRKSAVDRITKGDAVALYHVGVGVIAIGRASSDVRMAAVGKDVDEEHYVKCDFDFVSDPTTPAPMGVSASAINAHLKSSHRFRQTVYTLPAAADEFIRAQLKAKGAGKKLPVP